MNLDTSPDPEPEALNIQVRQVRGSVSSAPPEIKSSPCGSAAQKPAVSPTTTVCVDSVAQERFDLAVDACRGAKSEMNYFRQRNGALLKKLDPGYSLYFAVKQNPALEAQLYAIDLLQGRARKLSRKKVALACVYCALKPQKDDDFSACSDYTAYLLEAEAQKTSPDDFVEWAKPKRLKECLKEVRKRKQAEKIGDQDQPPSDTPGLRLSITRNANGVQGRMDGRAISLTQATLDAIVDLIEAATGPSGTGAEAGGTNV